MSRWGWHGAFTCRQQSIPIIGYNSVGPGWLHWGSVSPFFFCRPRCLGAAWQPQLNRLSDHRVCLAVLSWVRRSLSASAADVRLQQLRRGFIKNTTCALLFSAHIKGVKESSRSASYRKSMHALYDFLTVASFTLQMREFIPLELAHRSRMNTSSGNKHHFSLTCATQRALTDRSSPQQREQQLVIHHWLPPPCPLVDALLFLEAALPHRQPSECVDSACRSARRLIKLHPVPQAAAKLRPRWNKSSAAGIA